MKQASCKKVFCDLVAFEILSFRFIFAHVPVSAVKTPMHAEQHIIRCRKSKQIQNLFSRVCAAGTTHNLPRFVYLIIIVIFSVMIFAALV